MNVRFELSLLNGTLTGEGLPVPCADSGEGSGENADEVEAILLEHLQSGNRTALFPLGQFYYEQRKHEKAMHYFELAASENDWQAIFQLGVMYYDGIHCEPDMKRGFEYMFRVATSCEARASHLLRAAQFNIGRAYFQGSGVRRSVAEAERYWLLAADDGNPKASIKAQSTLGLLYSSPDHLDLKKAFYWHSEACGNGNLESQGALGVMYLEGFGVEKSMDKAFICLKDAANRGNVFAMGYLIAYYYRCKLFTKAMELAARVSYFEHPGDISEQTDCMEEYIRKGIAMACFYYGRCLSLGQGVQQDEDEAKKFYSRSFKFDPETCAKLQRIAQHGVI